MLIITIFINSTNNILYIGRERGPSCIGEDPFFIFIK
jgi:hypothetical protein